MEKKYRRRLRNRVMVSCALFSALLSLVIGGMGYYRYKINMEESYENYAGTLLQIAAGQMDAEGILRSESTGAPGNGFNEFQQFINQMKARSDARYIYLIYYQEGTNHDNIFYAMTAYTQEELEKEMDTIKYLGDPAGESDFSEEMQAAMKKSVEDKSRQARFIDNNTEVAGRFLSSTEYVKTAFLPIWTKTGDLTGILCLDISMNRIYDNLRAYLTQAAVWTFCLAAVFLALFLSVLNRQVVSPVRQIADSAKDFVMQSRTAREPSDFAFKEVDVKTGDEIEQLSDSLNHMVEELIRYMEELKTMALKQEKTAAEVRAATQIQNNLYPMVYPAFPERREFDVYARLCLAEEAGGDFYNYFFISPMKLCLMAGSVTGHGIPATMTAAVATTLMKNYAQLGYPPGRIFAEVNNQLSQDNGTELAACAFLGILDLGTGKMEYGEAGEMGAAIKPAARELGRLPGKRGIHLGSMKNVPYPQNTAHLVQGDMIFLYTPGLRETVDEKGNIYTDAGVEECLGRLLKEEADPERIAAGLFADADSFRANAKKTEDSTILIFRYYGPV